MEKIDSLKPALKSSSKESHDIASKVKNIEGKIRMPIHNVTFVQPLNDVTSNNSKPIGDIGELTVKSGADVTQPVRASSFASVLQNTQAKRSLLRKLVHALVENYVKNTWLKFGLKRVMLDDEFFIGDRLAFPLVENYVKNTWVKFGLKRVMLDDEFFLFQFETKDGMEKDMEGGPWLIRRILLFLNVWTPNTTLMKEEIKCAPVWIKLRHVPIVAYSEVGLSLITTQIGCPIMLDTYTSNTCLRSWGRKEYARALVEVSAEEELMGSMVIAIPYNDGKGHSLDTITIEYEWRPPRCATCKVFDHTDNKCPKITKVGVTSNVDSEGFVEVKKKKQKPNQPRHVEGVRLSKPKPNFYYRRIEKGETSQTGQNTNKEEVKGVNKTSNGRNSVNTNNETNEKWKHANHSINESDSEEEVEEIIMEEHQASWNIRGLNFSPKQSEVRQMIYDYKLSMCAILESHAKDSNLVKICSSVFKHWDWTSNGNLCSKEKKEMFCSFIYGHNRYTHRRALWDNLCAHNYYVRSRLWCLLGDFNAGLFMDDSTASSSRVDIAMREFKECIDEIEVMDIPSTGLHFTWNQKPKGFDGLLKKIDRVLGNMQFNDMFVGAHAIFKPYRTSDHAPAVLVIPTTAKCPPKPFKFANIITHHRRFKEVVSEGWSIDILGFWMFRLVKKLKQLKKPLRKLLYDYGNIHDNVIRLRTELDRVQTDLDLDPFNNELREEEVAYVQAYNQAILLQERFLKQKAKVQWLKEGDSNSAFFHKMVKGRMSRSRIDVVTDAAEGTTSCLNASNLFDQVLSSDMAEEMIQDVIDKEIKEALFSIGNDKSSGPDGYTAAFFKEASDIVGQDVIKAVKEFFTNGKILKELNHTIIALIPKVHTPTLKIIISPNQSAFVPGRSITDNILLTHELMHNYHLDRGVPRCTFKVDIQKAYDTVDWNFLRAALIGFGFHDKMISWIMECVTSTSFFVSINGSLHGHFKGNRGLRQGDPISPYLFMILMEVLTLMLRRRVREAEGFTYHRFCSDMELINLCFADDLFLFAHGDLHSAKIIMDLLDEFKSISGLTPSLPKSTAYFCNVLNHAKLAILQIMPFEEGRLPVKYLGVPLVPSILVYKAGSMKKGKSKVAWEVVCLPKDEGGLGIRRLDLFNKALMATHIWKLLTMKESLWVIQLRPFIRKFVAQDRDMYQAGSSSSSKVADLLATGSLVWPPELVVWHSFRPRDVKVDWVDVVWFSICIPRHAFNLWLVIKKKLKMQDRLSSWDVNGSLAMSYPLCESQPDSHEHLFFECSFSMQVWRHMRDFVGLSHVQPSLYMIVKFLIPMAKRRTSKSVASKLVIDAAIYYIWPERNDRLFNNSKRSFDQVLEKIKSSIRLKLMSCRFKKSKAGMDLLKR
ncbi:hypothetical protein Tco_0928373 [Tanacetum coccineum]